MKLTDKDKQLIEKYSDMFFNHGGNDIAELLTREGVNLFNNAPVTLLQCSVEGQFCMLKKLQTKGLLK